jgi:hypothetical protein
MRCPITARAALDTLAAIGVAALLVTAQSCAVGPVRAPTAPTASPGVIAHGLWSTYEQSLKNAKYIDLTHRLTPSIPVWKGFAPSTFGPALNPATGKPYRYATDGFEATRYELGTDQFGTQLDPPAHWAPEYPAIDELPATYAIRPLVVISIVEQVAKDPGYSLQVPKSDKILRWDTKQGVRVRQ